MVLLLNRVVSFSLPLTSPFLLSPLYFGSKLCCHGDSHLFLFALSQFVLLSIPLQLLLLLFSLSGQVLLFPPPLLLPICLQFDLQRSDSRSNHSDLS